MDENEQKAQEEMKKKSDLDRKIRMITSTIALMIGMISVVLTMFKAVQNKGDASIPPPTVDQINVSLNDLRSKTNEAITQISKLKNDMGILDNQSLNKGTSKEINKILIAQQNINERLNLLEAAILNNPTTALSMPLLRKDVDNLKTQYKENKDETARHLDRMYDQNKWFIGLMFTMAIGIVGLAISNFLQSRKT